MAFDIGLDPATGDLPPISKMITGSDLVAQRLKVRLGVLLGEVLHDTTLGLPWLEWLTTKPIRLNDIATQTRLVAEGTPGVVRVERWEVTHDAATRTVTINGQAVTDEQEIAIRDLTIATEGGNLSFAANFFGGVGPILP